MRLLLALTLIMTSYASLAQVDCPPGGKDPSVADELKNTVINQDNNKCPERTYQDNFPTATTMKEIQEISQKKFEELGVNVIWDGGTNGYANWSSFTDTPADINRAKRVANIALYALSRYPAGFLKKAGLKNLKLVKDLRVKDVNNVFTTRSASPFPQNKMMIYGDNDDIDCLAGIEMRMHHELFHLIEGTICHSMQFRDKKWQALNPPGFNYGNGGNTAYGIKGFQNLEHPRSGFVSEYSYFAEEEDKSEIFGKIMTLGYSSRVNGWSTVDPLLDAKVKYLKNFLKKKLSSEMDDTYYNQFSPAK